MEEVITALLGFSSISIITTFFIIDGIAATFSSEELFDRFRIFNLNAPNKDNIDTAPDNGCNRTSKNEVVMTSSILTLLLLRVQTNSFGLNTATSLSSAQLSPSSLV
jgi:hypothetical protein